MNSEFLGRTAAYALVALVACMAVAIWRYIERARAGTLLADVQQALLGAILLLASHAALNIWAFLMHQEATRELARAWSAPVLAGHRLALIAALLLMVRPWTMHRCGERGWIALLALTLVGGWILDWAV